MTTTKKSEAKNCVLKIEQQFLAEQEALSESFHLYHVSDSRDRLWLAPEGRVALRETCGAKKKNLF